MHPYAHHHWHGFRHRRGGRIVWFAIGATVATFWHKSHEAHEWREQHCWRKCIPREAYAPPPGPVPANLTPVTSDDAAGSSKIELDRQRWGWAWNSEKGWKSWGNPPLSRDGAFSPHVPPTPMPSDRNDEDLKRMQALGKQATDTGQIAELSEATLDSVLATVRSLKTKLAEARLQREQHLQQIQALKEEQYKMFEEWQKQREQQAQAEQAKEQATKPRHMV